LSPGYEWDPKSWRSLSPRGWANGGGGGEAPSQGVWGMCPQNFQVRGELPTLATPPRVGPKTLANPQLTRVGKKGGPGGQSPMAGGCGGCAPRKPKLGRVAHSGNPATSGTQNVGKPRAHGGGQKGGTRTLRGHAPNWTIPESSAIILHHNTKQEVNHASRIAFRVG